MAFEEYVYSGTERLRRGYTTGTCAALAARAATIALLSGTIPDEVSLLTPKGIEVRVEVHGGELGQGPRRATCAVIKDAGDDYDVTDGAEVRSTVELHDADAAQEGPGAPRVSIDGGRGVGRVTKPGLDQPVGNAAINSGPRKMIEREVIDVLDDYESTACAHVLVEVVGGEELAKKTFNPHIGVEGGISILGTSGIVEPRSLEALKSSLDVEIHAARATGSPRLVITPGNYGEAFIEGAEFPEGVPVVKCANFIGHALDRAAIEGFSEVVFVGHIGKLVKVAGGIMDTHSRVADCRCEIFAAHAALAGAGRETLARIMASATTDACIDILKEDGGAGLADDVLRRIADAVQERLARRAAGAFEIGAVIFSNKRGLLAVTAEAGMLLDKWNGPFERGDRQ